MSEQTGSQRGSAALAMWRDYGMSRPQPSPPEEEPWVGPFGDGPDMADGLLTLVLAGTKRATAGLVRNHIVASEPLPRVGGHWVVCDGQGVPRCVLRSVELRIGRLDSVDDTFAWDEGEGDRTRASWLATHLAYFRRTQEGRGEAWSDDLEVVFERFSVVWPPEVADEP
jgi:uncharacterized protein YhfF